MFDVVMFLVGLGCGTICAYGLLSQKLFDKERQRMMAYRNGVYKGIDLGKDEARKEYYNEIYEIQKYRNKLKEEFDDINELTEKWLKVKERKEPTNVEDREH